MLKICKDLILFELGLWEKKEERKKKERKKMNKIEISTLVFSKLLKVSGNFGVDIALEY